MQKYQPPHLRRHAPQPQSQGQGQGQGQVQAPTAAPPGPDHVSAASAASAAGGTGPSTRLPPGRTLSGPQRGSINNDPYSSVRAAAPKSGQGSGSGPTRLRPSRKDWSAPPELPGPSGPSGSRAPRSSGYTTGPGPQGRGGGSTGCRSRVAGAVGGRDVNVNVNVLASPSEDIRPMRNGSGNGAGAKVQIGEMELMQSVSRSGGDGAQGDALKDPTTQERYRAYINERIQAHYTTFGTPRHTPPMAGAVEEQESLGSIVLLFRKLREGVVASHRLDSFAIEVFESSARFAILAQNRAQLLSALSGLVPGLYTAVGPGSPSAGPSPSASTSSAATDLTDRLDRLSLSLDQDCRAEFASLLLLYHLATGAGGPGAFHALLVELSLSDSTRKRKRLRTPFSSSSSGSGSGSGPRATATAEAPTVVRGPTEPESKPEPQQQQPFLPRSSLSYAIKASRALCEETFNPLLFFSLLHQPEATPYERAILSWAEEGVRERAWERMKKGYMAVGERWAGRLLGLGWSLDAPGAEGGRGKEDNKGSMSTGMRGWVEQRGGAWEDGRIKLR